MTTSGWTRQSLSLSVEDTDLVIDTILAPGAEPVVFLHGFGSTKEDYADFVRFPGLTRFGFISYDAPGFGGSGVADTARVSIPFLVDVALAVLDRLGIERFHVVGHSMGGLTALLLAARAPGAVLSFTDIEGNLAPEDCFLSRQILTHDADSPESFLRDFAARAHEADEFSSALYGSRVLTTVDPGVVRPVFESMVDLSDHGDLLTGFTGLPMPRMFMYGEQNATLSYLPVLAEHGVSLVEIPYSGHWPMYSNPVSMWAALTRFYQRQRHGDLPSAQ